VKFLGVTKENVQKSDINCFNDLPDSPNVTAKDLLNLNKTYNRKKYTHVRLSELAVFCPREYVLGYKYGKVKEAFTEYPLMQQFELGSALHFWYQNFSKVFKDVLYGYWRCWACGNLRGKGKSFFGTRKEVKATPCEHCGAKPDATFYHEFYFRVDEPYRVVGKIDGFIMKDNELYIIDFKTFFEKGDFPKPQDKIQLAGYMFFYELLPDDLKLSYKVNTSAGYLYYISKKFNYRDSILAYEVQKEDKLIEPIKKNVGMFTRGVKEGIIPEPFDICIRSGWSRGKAKNCYLRDLCRQEYEASLHI